ncbi:MAG TPA: type III secretion system export apparatus subunit SctU [Methylibium sp.]|uniref:type III secretion system export apparatus subunit SctU n=1 Tax=Methylibium sp. TaxID=2067992 RepID=UPI002DB5B0CD|nr:type III secretion system export apparatus subunit SctU [Methylibium sp.]HEU4459590.1 type III secretion system export apparatus subunit SctU [Methylibium sp.]
MSDEKTEEPTDKKLQDARKQGQVAKSQDLAMAISSGGMVLLLSASASMTWDRLGAIFERSFSEVPKVVGGDFVHLYAVMLQLLADTAMAILPFVACSVLLGVLANMGQTGVLLSFEAVSLKFEKLNPADNLKNMVSVKSLVELGKSVVKAIVLGWVLWILIRDLTPLLVGSSYVDPVSIGRIAWEAILKLMFASVILFIVIGPVDYGIQKWLFLKDQRMTKDEIKREHKDAEGDPELKGKRKQIAQEMIESPPERTVPGASVVVTNPTHYAVALRYEAGETPLPIVVAKGVDGEAMRIRRIAEEHGIPQVQDPPLARALHKLEINDAVPESLFEAVAAVLRWVMVVRSVGGKGAPAAQPPH